MTEGIASTILNRFTRENLPWDGYKGRRVLVTGGAGFIGSWLVETLTRMGATVFVVDNLWRGSLSNLTLENGAPVIPFEERFILGDLTDFGAAQEAFRKSKPDIVFHLADIVAGIEYVFSNEPFIFRSNLLINTHVFKAAQEFGVKQVIYLGTACSYPRTLQQEPGCLPLVEDQVFPADPESAYGWSKLMGEYEIELISRNSAMEVGVLRLHNVYGPRAIFSKKRSQVIPSLIRKAILYPIEDFVVWGSGKQARDFVYVGDVVDAILRMPLKGMGRGAIQIGTAMETTVSELASTIIRISGKEIALKFDLSKPEGDIARSGNFDKASQLLGWNVFTPIEEGLKSTYDWIYEQIVNRHSNYDD